MMVKSLHETYIDGMKISWPTVAITTAGLLAAGFFVPVGTWETLRPALLPAISIIAAAVLVRLARGMPFTNADHFDLDQFRQVAKNLEANARKLRALIFVCLAAVVLLIVANDAVEVIDRLTAQEWVADIAGRGMSATIAWLLLYAFWRIVEVVHSDVSLLRLQSKILEGVITSKNAADFEGRVIERSPAKIAGADNFGKQLPH
ncbi:hypothetical protein [Qipengyuania nanhaisediminis]|nr:hypothetical protein [Qipengyuania nanhaisediminis]